MADYDPTNPKPEIVIALAGPVGTNLDAVATLIEEELSPYHYKSHHVKVSSLIQDWCAPDVKTKLMQVAYDERVHLLMNAGDVIRSKQSKGQALLPMIISRIRVLREEILTGRGFEKIENLEAYNTCYIVNSLKHPDEVRFLREVYGTKLLVVSAFSSVKSRTDRLCELIAKSRHTTDLSKFTGEAEDLIEKDSQRSNTELGQNLRHTFPLADFFVSTDRALKSDTERFFECIFGNPYKTPTSDEYFMYEAASAALRSADLSRQVGAAVTDSNRNLLTKGCNEVPAFKGNAYWPEDPEEADFRDYKKGQDYNAVKKVEILEELFEFLLRRNIVAETADDAVRIVESLVFGDEADRFKNLRVSNLIEFGRMIHAEMAALMDAARRGVSVGGGTLYCTTFPCHMCARHIIAAGLERVVYVEPYPKSMAQELYSDMLEVDGVPSDKNRPETCPEKVRFEPFVGIAPKIYPRIFSYIKRKNERGHIVQWAKAQAQPRVAILAAAHLNVELTIAKDVASIEIVSLDDIDAMKGTRGWLDSAK